jgi:hypothetical protein
MRIKVGNEHIENAIKKDSHKCMIADAIHKAIPYARYIMVDTQSIRFSDLDAGQRYIYLTPPEAQKNILKFDRGETVRPFEINLNRRVTRQMRVRQADMVGKKRKKRVRSKTKSKRVMPSREREFGLRKFVDE